MKIKSIVTNIINTISIIIIVASVLILLSVFFTKSGQAPNIGGLSFFRVVTGSMEPEIETDSFIVVKKTDPSKISEGDIISFYGNTAELQGAVNTHRVVSIINENGTRYFETKGDANAVVDKELTNEDNVIGVVIGKSKLMGKIVNLITNPLVFFPLIVLPLIVLLITNLISSVRSAREIMKQEEEQAIKEAVEAYKKKKKEEQDTE